MTTKKGTDNIRNRLSESDVIEIYSNQVLTQHALAKKYDVSQGTINHIKKKRTWKWLTDKHDQGF